MEPWHAEGTTSAQGSDADAMPLPAFETAPRPAPPAAQRGGSTKAAEPHFVERDAFAARATPFGRGEIAARGAPPRARSELREARRPVDALGIRLDLLESHARTGGDPARLLDAIEEMRRCVDDLHSSLRRIEHVVDDEVDGPCAPRLDAVRLFERLRAVHGVHARHAGVRLELRPPRPGEIELPPRAAEQLWIAMTNLASNAIRYADPAKRGRRAVLVVLRRHGATLRLDVADNGIGTPASWLSRVWAVGVRAPQRRDDLPGSGLGLAIVRDALEDIGPTRRRLRSRVDIGTWLTMWIAAPARDAAA